MILTIRPEQPADISPIREVVKQAFHHAEHTNQREHAIVDALREAKELYLSRVAERDGQMIGHIAVCRIHISHGQKGWFGIGPVSVIPEYQGKGGGSRLIQSTLEQLEESGAKGCVLVGDPAYYTRFGFKQVNSLTFSGIPQGYFLARSFGKSFPKGEVSYPAAFGSSDKAV